MGRFVLRLALILAAVYFYTQGSGSWAMLCVVALFWSSIREWADGFTRVITHSREVPSWLRGKGFLRRFDKADAQRLYDYAFEHDANTLLTYAFRVDLVVAHAAVDELFMRLREAGKAPAATLEEWRALLSESYARKYKRHDQLCELRFNIKSNVLFINGAPDFMDHVYHELLIPYRWKDDATPEEANMFAPQVEAQLSIRVLLVNGKLLLQVGQFDKQYSPRMLRGERTSWLAVYETYVTVTSFPLLYFSRQHGIPPRYLNPVAEVTASYKARFTDNDVKVEWYADWHALRRELVAYRILCDAEDGDYSEKLLDKLRTAFEQKRTPLLEAEGWQSDAYAIDDDDEDDDDDWPDLGHSYWNQYGRIGFRNMNANRGTSNEARWFTDYHEDEP